MENMLRIGLIGQVASGKSSFLNALVGELIARTGLSRTTLKPEEYSIYSGPDGFAPTDENWYASSLVNRECIVTDFPGINDAGDKSGEYFRYISSGISKINILVYITSVETAFTLSSEHNIFQRILDLVNEQNLGGVFTDLLILVNKYEQIDEQENSEYETIIDDFRGKYKLYNGKEVPIFRMSSHSLLCKHIQISGKRPPPTKENGRNTDFAKILRNSGFHVNGSELVGEYEDFDDIFGYINGMKIEELEYQVSMAAVLAIDDIQGIYSNPRIKDHIKSRIERVRLICEKMGTRMGDDERYVGWIYSLQGRWTSTSKNYSVKWDDYIEFLLLVMIDDVQVKEGWGTRLINIYYGRKIEYEKFVVGLKTDIIMNTSKHNFIYHGKEKISEILLETHIGSRELSNDESTTWLHDGMTEDLNLLKDLICISRTPINVLVNTNNLIPNIYQRFFVKSYELYKPFIKKIYSNPTSEEILGTSLFDKEDVKIIENIFIPGNSAVVCIDKELSSHGY
jgi:GTPase SAR1 family protein